ncbi:MAG: modified peptide precursor CbpA [Elusimicrobia bacterium]|nr:modified peptide precursor CbpA [Elusimicrobiota bacterium]
MVKESKVKSTKRDRTSPKVIAYRRSCNVQGTGLTHYILMGDQAK